MGPRRDRRGGRAGRVRAAPRPAPAPYQVQAAIACLHGLAPTYDDTDWPQIAELYAVLESRQPTPVVRLNRAVAVAHAESPAAGLALLDGLDSPAMTAGISTGPRAESSSAAPVTTRAAAASFRRRSTAHPTTPSAASSNALSLALSSDWSSGVRCVHGKARSELGRVALQRVAASA